MVYSNKFVTAVIVNGQVQPELANGTVPIPWGEYTLRFRNKNDRRAVVRIFIDGEDVGGNGYVIPARDHVDIKRHNLRDASFKLVPLTSGEAVDAGKNGPNLDKQIGVVEARFYLEKKVEPVQIHHHYHQPLRRSIAPITPPWRPQPWGGYPGQIWLNDSCTLGDSAESKTLTSGGGTQCGSMLSANCGAMDKPNFGVPGTTVVPTWQELPKLQDGATVEGQATGQIFSTMYIDLESDYVSLKLFLQGYDPVTEKIASPKPKHEKTNRELQEENNRLQEEIDTRRRLRDLEQQQEAERQRLLKINEDLRKELELVGA